MSEYIFNCFKEHVTTGVVCSLSAATTDVLTEWKGQVPLSLCFSLPGVHTRAYASLAHVHVYSKDG